MPSIRVLYTISKLTNKMLAKLNQMAGLFSVGSNSQSEK